MIFVTHKKITFIVAGIITLVALGAFAVYGLKPSIEFTGGSNITATTSVAVDPHVLEREIEATVGADASVRPYGDNGITIRTRPLTPAEKDTVVALLPEGSTETSFSLIGPTVGDELRTKSLWSMLIVLIAIAIFIAIAFGRVSKPVASWKYGVIALITLLHDVAVPVGVFAILGVFMGVEVDTLFVVALLTVLGYSINDTIIVFDRVREILKSNQEKNRTEAFDKVVGRSINETLTRSINTSLTVMIVLAVLFFIGSEATKMFALALFLGVFAGTYSSVALAAPMLVAWQEFDTKRAFKKKKA